MTTTVRRISVTDTAKIVRAALHETFPTTTFKVRSSSYSGGASVDVRWTDGPTSGQVDAILNRYEGATFDAMIDLKSNHDSELNGETVHYGADYVHGQRNFSVEFILRCATVTCAYFDLPVPPMSKYNWFDYSPETSVHPMGGHDTLIDLFNQVMNVTNADDETVQLGHYGTISEWITEVWDKAHSIGRPPVEEELAILEYNLPGLLTNHDVQFAQRRENEIAPAAQTSKPHCHGYIDPYGVVFFHYPKEGGKVTANRYRREDMSPRAVLWLCRLLQGNCVSTSASMYKDFTFTAYFSRKATEMPIPF